MHKKTRHHNNHINPIPNQVFRVFNSHWFTRLYRSLWRLAILWWTTFGTWLDAPVRRAKHSGYFTALCLTSNTPFDNIRYPIWAFQKYWGTLGRHGRKPIKYSKYASFLHHWVKITDKSQQLELIEFRMLGGLWEEEEEINQIQLGRGC